MRTWKSRIAVIALASLVWVAPLSLGEVIAAEPESAEIDLEALSSDRAKKADKYPVAPRINRYIAAAAAAVDEGDPAKANELLRKLNPKRLNPLERAVVYRMLAYVAYGQDESEQAITYFGKALDEEVLPIRDDTRIHFYIAQLNASMQRWPEVVRWLNHWLLYVEKPDPLGFYLMGIAYYQMEEFDRAIDSTSKAIELSPEPREAWLRLLAALYAHELEHAKAVPVLEELVLRFPKKQYWVQLSLIYGAQENYRRSLAVQQVAYAQGLLTDDKELRRLARSYLYHELPYPAANLLKTALETGAIEGDAAAFELLANSWIAAREYERSIEPLRSAAEVSEGGDLFVRLGQVYMQREAWREASALLAKAIDKGKLKDPGNADLLLGIAYYNDTRISLARSSFLRARRHESTRGVANRWLTHLEAAGDASS